MKLQSLILVFTLVTVLTQAQVDPKTPYTKSEKDSLFIFEIEDKKSPDKVLHAEPLYIDLIRDLGARKGEKEWNFGMGITDNQGLDVYEALVEYEWAPIDRLGLEIEVPVTIYSTQNRLSSDSVPSDRIESLKVAAQWSFYVNERIATSMAIGYIHEFELSDLDRWGKPLIRGNIYNPFFIIAKRWGRNYHSLIYTGPRIEHEFKTNTYHHVFEMHSNFHYMIPGTRNFIGIEFNKYFEKDDFDMTMRPQIRVGVADNFLIGVAIGIPVARENENFSSFARVIWEPGHRHNGKH